MEYKNSKKEIAWGDHYFLEHVAPADFNYKAHKKELSPFWESLGFKCSMMYSDFYSHYNGIKSDKYIPMDLYYFYVLPALNRFDFRMAYTDKNLYDVLFHDINRPQTILKCMNGNLYTHTGELISFEEAVNLLKKQKEDCIIKPSVDSCNGVGIDLLRKNDIEEQIKSYGKNFIVQEKVKQHPQMAKLNETSLNTLRIFTYRDLHGCIHYLEGKSCCRFGGDNSVKDNLSSGGGAFSISDNGLVNGCIMQFKNLNIIDTHNNVLFQDFIVPQFEKVKKFVKELHNRLPYFDFIGWDIAIDSNGEPLFIEFNIEPSIEMPQMLSGVFGGKFFNEIVQRFVNVSKEKSNCYRNIFENGFEYQLIVNK